MVERRRTKYPLESFGPELIEAMKKAALGVVRVRFASKRKAHVFQQRIHMLRGRMERANHPDFKLVAKVRTSLLYGTKADPSWPDRGSRDMEQPAIVELKPYDIEFISELREAGVISSDKSPTLDISEEEYDPLSGFTVKG